MMDEERRDPEIRVEQALGPEDERVEEIFPPGVEGVPPGAVNERAPRNPGAIRAEDTEPYLALQYVARLFKIAAIVVIVALTAEVIAGVAMEGMGALFPLFAEVIKGIVLAAILWGAGDLTILMIDVGHDVRAARVLLGRISARGEAEALHDEDRPGAP
jgi:hypothetical protein